MTFTVVYENETITAKTPLEAAKWVRDSIVNGEALCFTVKNESTKELYSVDLGEEDENAVVQLNLKG